MRMAKKTIVLHVRQTNKRTQITQFHYQLVREKLMISKKLIT